MNTIRFKTPHFSRTLLLCATFVLLAMLSSAPADQPQPYLDTYEQKLIIRFKSASAAEKASLSILPLYEGKELAVTCRWDDNWYDNNPTIAKMTEEIGIKGTFFLNAINGADDIPRYKMMGEACLAAGHSLGTHGLVHSPTSVNNPNYLAEEFLRDRILIESTFNTPANSHAWAFMDSGGNYFMDEGHALVAEVLFRSGLICSAQDFGVSIRNKGLCPRIGKSYNNHSEKLTPETFAKRIEKMPEDEPSIYIMPIHTQWYKDDADEIAQAKTVAGNTHYWYCTISQYAAYRNQFLRTEIKSEIDGKNLIAHLIRPILRDLNDATPITLQITGCDATEVRDVEIPSAKVTPVENEEFYRFHLAHDTDQALPAQVGAVINDENQTTLLNDENFAPLKGVLFVDGDQLNWVLENNSEAPLRDIRLAFRLPYAYESGVVSVELKSIAAGKTEKGTLPLKLATDDYKYLCGAPFFVLQVDAVVAENPEPLPIRFYLTTLGPENPISPDYPKGNFATLGPIPDVEWNDTLLQSLLDHPKNALILSTGTELIFSTQETNVIELEHIPEHKKLIDGYARYWEAEMVLTTGTMIWLGKPLYGYWMLHSQITSPEKQEIYLLGDDSIQDVYLNGEKLTLEESKDGWGWQAAKRNRYRCPMNAGANDFFVVAHVGQRNAFQSKQGTMIYFTTDKKNQTPLKGLTFQLPKS